MELLSLVLMMLYAEFHSYWTNLHFPQQGHFVSIVLPTQGQQYLFFPGIIFPLSLFFIVLIFIVNVFHFLLLVNYYLFNFFEIGPHYVVQTMHELTM